MRWLWRFAVVLGALLAGANWLAQELAREPECERRYAATRAAEGEEVCSSSATSYAAP